MTDPTVDEPEREDDAVRDMVRKALSADVVAKDAPELLRGVQQRIRRRSRGKFFADGWSTGQARTSYVLVALAMVLLVALAFYALGPMDVR